MDRSPRLILAFIASAVLAALLAPNLGATGADARDPASPLATWSPAALSQTDLALPQLSVSRAGTRARSVGPRNEVSSPDAAARPWAGPEASHLDAQQGVTQARVARYDGPAGGPDIAKALAGDGAGNVYATRSSEGVGSGKDIVTVKCNSSGWPMFRHDPAHTGYNPCETKVRPPLRLKWSFTSPTGGGFDSSPAVSHGVVYAMSGGGDNRLYALDAATGALRWSYSIGGSYTPNVADGVVYEGSDDGKVYALDASTGALRWSYSTGGYIRSSPAVVAGVVYVGSYDGKVYALDADTGDLRWSYTTGNATESSPAVAAGLVYVGSDDNKLYALDAHTGGLRWSYTTGGYVRSSPAAVAGVVYVGSEDGKVYALDSSTGALRWSYTTTGPVRSSPAVVDGVVYVGAYASGHNLYALDAATGRLKWSYAAASEGVYSSPAVANGVIYVGTAGFGVGRLIAADADSGALIWSYTTGRDVMSSPAVAGGAVYIGSRDRKIYAFESDNPPAAVTDLSVRGFTTDSIALTWTAPGGDGRVGTAAAYDIRYSTSPINSANWASATQATGEPRPQRAGTREMFTVTGLLPGSTYHFALRTADEAGNSSGLSNVVKGATKPGTGGHTGPRS